ncbi:hypothetical protein [Mangrovibacter phragmitis]|uniref:hypothetical protein n=1 Tax=Mangrovibacter phragmitis TaxID=1691903 RepID=UPI00336A8B22
MPNLTFYISENHGDKFKNLDDFTHKCSVLCCDILGAEPKNIHIIFVYVKAGCGQPVCAELFYRLTALRTHEVMENFMRQLDFATQQVSGLTTRIRCFGYPAEHIFARN